MIYVVLKSWKTADERLGINGYSVEEERELRGLEEKPTITAGIFIKNHDDLEGLGPYDAISDTSSIQFKSKALYIDSKGIYYKTSPGKEYLNDSELKGLNEFLNGVRDSGKYENEIWAPDSPSAPDSHLAPDSGSDSGSTSEQGSEPDPNVTYIVRDEELE